MTGGESTGGWRRSAERWRWLVVLAALLGLVGLGVRYSQLVLTVPDGIRACLAEPQAHDGRELVLPVWFVAAVDGPRRYRVSRVIEDVAVEGPTEGLQPGQVITVVGTFRSADSVVVEVRRTIHTRRAAKQALSLIGLLGALVAGPWFFTVRVGYLRLRSSQRDA